LTGAFPFFRGSSPLFNKEEFWAAEIQQKTAFYIPLLIYRFNTADTRGRIWCPVAALFHYVPNCEHCFLYIFKHLMFPEPADAPPIFLEPPCLLAVTSHIFSQFSCPELSVGSWANIVLRAAMPLAAIDKNHYPLPLEHKVGAAVLQLDMDPKAHPCPPQARAQQKFRGGIAPLDAGHLLGSAECHVDGQQSYH
jgi:hypothetical protein